MMFRAVVLLVLAVVSLACVPPTNDAFDAADASRASRESPPSTCPDFAGRWSIDPANGHCHLQEGLQGELSIQLPGEDGYALSEVPTVLVIEQVGCRELAFRVVEDSASHPMRDAEGREFRFDLVARDDQDVSWTENRVAVRYRVGRSGAVIFPGIARRWAAWSLEEMTPDHLEYRYAFTEKGAALLVFPFEDHLGSSCRLQRLSSDIHLQ